METRLVHVTINTTVLEESISFYEDVLGLRISKDMRPHRPIVFLGESAASVQIELIENSNASFGGRGISLGYHVDDVEKRRRELLESGYAPTELFSPAPDVHFFFVRDPNGLTIQFI